MQDVYGCVLFSEYTVGTILRDLAYVFAFEEGEVPPSPVVQPGTLKYIWVTIRNDLPKITIICL